MRVFVVEVGGLPFAPRRDLGGLRLRRPALLRDNVGLELAVGFFEKRVEDGLARTSAVDRLARDPLLRRVGPFEGAAVECDVFDGPVVELLDRIDGPEVDVLVNYTVFADLVRAIGARA